MRRLLPFQSPQKQSDSLASRLDKLRDLVNIQASTGNWNVDSYMLGLYNGMELSLATMENRSPDYRDLLVVGSRLRTGMAIRHNAGKRMFIVAKALCSMMYSPGNYWVGEDVDTGNLVPISGDNESLINWHEVDAKSLRQELDERK